MSDKRRKVKSRLKQSGEDGANPWPDEPAEFDPHSLGPATGLSTGDEDYDVDDETFRSFYAAVVLANIGLFGVTVGPMLWFFRGETLIGGGLFVVGAVAIARTYRIQQRYKQRRKNESDPSDDPSNT
ncbi:DUF7322 domain-containing protein [Halorarius litoreus]|uniref:DUF7322 domain-containing protein n=1 Tax=Halorarius litoreus TaxID=2962676 RepID=UPI0020CB8F4B|nr:hypothetical protein [Halorarius litoreus]